MILVNHFGSLVDRSGMGFTVKCDRCNKNKMEMDFMTNQPIPFGDIESVKRYHERLMKMAEEIAWSFYGWSKSSTRLLCPDCTKKEG